MNQKVNKVVSRSQIPEKYWAARPKIVQWVARGFLRVFGWRVDGFVPRVSGNENLIIIAGPHTSNWDGIFGFAAILGLDAKITFFGKHSLFKKPILGKFLNYMGGIPVDKTKPGSGLTDTAIKNMKKLNGSIIAMSPEGTRAKTEKLRSGFLRIAKLTKAKILLISIDSPTKCIQIGNIFEPSGDTEMDLNFVQDYYQSFKGINPKQS